MRCDTILLVGIRSIRWFPVEATDTVRETVQVNGASALEKTRKSGNKRSGATSQMKVNTLLSVQLAAPVTSRCHFIIQRRGPFDNFAVVRLSLQFFNFFPSSPTLVCPNESTSCPIFFYFLIPATTTHSYGCAAATRAASRRNAHGNAHAWPRFHGTATYSRADPADSAEDR